MGAGLQLLMRDAPVCVEFAPPLSSAQYDELLGVVQRLSTRATIADLKEDVKAAAQRWAVDVVFSKPKPSSRGRSNPSGDDPRARSGL